MSGIATADQVGQQIEDFGLGHPVEKAGRHGNPPFAGQTQQCGSNVGACRVGTKRCDASGNWGPCVGETKPREDICADGIDQDCDGSDATQECKDPVVPREALCPSRASSTAPASDTSRCVHSLVVSPPWCTAQMGAGSGKLCGERPTAARGITRETIRSTLVSLRG